MPQPESVRPVALLALGATVLLLSACNSSTALRRDASRGAYRQVAHEVRIDPAAKSRGTAYTMVQVAQSRLMSGDPAGAATAAERAIKAYPASAEAHSLLALSMDAMGRTAQAGPHHRRAAELAPEHGALLNNYGIWLCSSGQARVSLDWFERAVAAPGYATPDAALANAAACALRAGDAGLSEASARRALEAAPANPLALATLARLSFDAGRRLEARAFVQRRLAAGPADADTLQLASQIEQSLGDTAAAARYVQRLRTEFPPDSRPMGKNDD